jgi:hypothetical protein
MGRAAPDFSAIRRYYIRVDQHKSLRIRANTQTDIACGFCVGAIRPGGGAVPAAIRSLAGALNDCRLFLAAFAARFACARRVIAKISG